MSDQLRNLIDSVRTRLQADLDAQLVPATVAGREQLFHNELVQTLAGGDRSLLG